MKKFLSNTKGVAAVEFALTVGLFLFVFFMNFELSRLAITSGYLDLGVSQSIRAAKNAQVTGGDYEKVFREALVKYLGSPEGTFMKFLLHANVKNLQVAVKYTDCSSDQKKCIDALLEGRYLQPKKDSGNIISPVGTNVTLAYYSLQSYDFEFKTVFPFLPHSWMSNALARNFIVVHEYERTMFK